MDLKELLAKHTVEGVINFEEAETSFQTHVNGIVKKGVKKEVGKKETELMTNFISELGIEATDLQGVKTWVSTVNDNSTDFKNKSATLQTELDKVLKSNKTLTSEYSNFKQDTLIGSLNIEGEQAEFLKYKFNKGVTDDVTFENQFEEYKKNNRDDTHKVLNNNFDDGETSSPLEALKKIRDK